MTSGLSQLFIERECSVADKLATEFKNMLKDISNISIKRHQREIQSNQPLFLLIKKSSRIGADIDRAVKILTDTPMHMVALVVIHINEPHALPSVMTKDVLFDEKYYNYGLIVDMAFIQGKYYECKMNMYGRKQLEEFIQKHPNKKMTQIGGNAENPSQVPMELFIQPDLKEYLKFAFDRLGEKLNLDQKDGLLHLKQTKPWIVVCMQGHYIQQELQHVADIFVNPKLMLILHKNEVKESSVWSAKHHLLTYELSWDYLGYFLENNFEYNKDMQEFRSMIVSAHTENQASATKNT